MRGVFICYRRDDSAGHAGRLFDHLVQALGGDVFMDVGGIKPGADFVSEIESRLKACETLLAVIGPGWLSVPPGGDQPRLFLPDDYVRLELTRALNYGTRVIPVLLNGADMPSERKVPSHIRPLTRRQAFRINDDTFGEDVDRLVREIRPEAAPPPPQAWHDERHEAVDQEAARYPRPTTLRGRRRATLVVAGAIAALAALGGAVLGFRAIDRRRAPRGNGPAMPGIADLQTRTKMVAAKYKEELLTRFGNDGWCRSEVQVAGKDPWGQAQALAALFSTPSSLALFDSVLRQPLQVLLESRGADGWSGGSFHKYPHVEPVIWTGVVFAGLEKSSFKSELATHQKWFREMLRRYRSGVVWHEFPRQVPSRPSVYATALALVMLVEIWEASNGRDAALKREIDETTKWLGAQASYSGSELRGWMNEVGSHSSSVGVSLLTAYALMRAQREVGADPGISLAEQVPKLLEKLGVVTFDQDDGYYFIGGSLPNLLNHHVRIAWSPWALASAMEWHRAYASTAPAEARAIVLRQWSALLAGAEAQNVQTTYVFLLAEHLYVLAQAGQS